MGTHLRKLRESYPTWQGLDGFKKSFHPNSALDKSSLGIGRVKQIIKIITLMLILGEGESCSFTVNMIASIMPGFDPTHQTIHFLLLISVKIASYLPDGSGNDAFYAF